MRVYSKLLTAGIAAALPVMSANADMVLVIDDIGVGGIEVIIADGLGAGQLTDSGLVTTHADTDGLNGILSFDAAIPGSVFTVNTTVGISKPVIGSTSFGMIDLSSINVSSAGAGGLTISLTDTEFFNNSGLLGYTADIGGTTDGSIDFFAGTGNTNLEFVTTDSVADLALGPGAFSSSLGGSDTFSGNYSLTLQVDVHHIAAGQVSDFDGVIEVIPGPGAVALAGIAFVGLGRRRRRRGC